MKKNEQGAALVVALVLLLLLTLLGTDSIQNSMLDMYLSKGFRDQNHAFQSAETGLRLAEDVLQGTISQAAATTLLSANNITLETGFVDYSNSSYWDTMASYGGDYRVKIVVQPWRFVSDSLSVGSSAPIGISYYRVTARGADPEYEAYLESGNSEDYKKSRSLVILQSIYAVRHSN